MIANNNMIQGLNVLIVVILNQYASYKSVINAYLRVSNYVKCLVYWADTSH